MNAQARLVETLNKACGTVEVARDLLGRSGSMYLQVAESADPAVAKSFTHATQALSRVVEALRRQLHEVSLGPAA